MPNISPLPELISQSFRTHPSYVGETEVSREIFSQMAKQRSKKERRGDPELLDRLNRAMGAYQARTGKAVEWQELAAAAGLKPSTMSDIVSLERMVRIKDAVAFADYLGVNFAWLAANRGAMRDEEGGGATAAVKPPPEPTASAPKSRMPIYTDPNRVSTVVERFTSKKKPGIRRRRKPGDQDKSAMAS